ncbi:MAG: SurA N-terminal domain-containing protein [Proteobacteria bacterium]|nr:SurA N-terminal domain-containing protein [Pseudomonadota bacterium]
MLESIRKGQRWLTAVFVGAIGLVFAAFVGLGGPLTGGPAAGSVVEVNGLRFDTRDYYRVRASQEQRFRQILGDSYDANATQGLLDTQSVQILVNEGILASEAQRLGLDVSMAEIQRDTRRSFRNEEGRFDPESFRDYAEYEYGNERNYVEATRRNLLARKMLQLLWGQTRVSEGEARARSRHRLEQVRIAYVALDTERLPADQPLDDEAVAAYLAENEASVRAQFDEQAEDFQTPAQTRARHILFQKGENAETAADAQGRAQAALDRIREGAAFEDVALELDEDPATRTQGGDLGFVTRGELDGRLEAVIFSLEPGTLAEELVETDRGYHVVKVEERREGGTRPFDEVANELARGLAEKDAAAKRAAEVGDALLAAVREGEALEDAARAQDLTLERTALLSRRPDGFVPGLGGSPDLLAAAFALDVGESAARVFRVGTKDVLVQAIERNEPDDLELAKAATEERERLESEKRNERVESWINTRRDELTQQQRLHVNLELVQAQ